MHNAPCQTGKNMIKQRFWTVNFKFKNKYKGCVALLFWIFDRLLDF